MDLGLDVLGIVAIAILLMMVALGGAVTYVIGQMSKRPDNTPERFLANG